MGADNFIYLPNLSSISSFYVLSVAFFAPLILLFHSLLAPSLFPCSSIPWLSHSSPALLRLPLTSICYLFPPFTILLSATLPQLLTGGDGHSAEGVVSAQSPGQLHQPDAGRQGARGGREHRREEENQQGTPDSVIIDAQTHRGILARSKNTLQKGSNQKYTNSQHMVQYMIPDVLCLTVQCSYTTVIITQVMIMGTVMV